MRFEGPSVKLTTRSSYTAGGPILVGVTVLADAPGMFYVGLASIGWFESADHAHWTIRPVGGDERVISGGYLNEEADGGLHLDYGESLSMMVDLSEFAPDLVPGRYEVKVGFPVDEFAYSDWATLTVGPSDRETEAAYRAVAGSAEDRWSHFFEVPPPANTPSLPPSVESELALHLFLRDVLFGSESLGRVSLDRLDGIRGGPLDGEREVLRYELLRARNHPAADRVRRRIRAKWPGLLWRVEIVDDGYGFLMLERLQAAQWRAHHERKLVEPSSSR